MGEETKQNKEVGLLYFMKNEIKSQRYATIVGRAWLNGPNGFLLILSACQYISGGGDETFVNPACGWRSSQSESSTAAHLVDRQQQHGREQCKPVKVDMRIDKFPPIP